MLDQHYYMELSVGYQKFSHIEDEGRRMRMIRWICGHTGLNKIRNKVIRDKIGVTPIKNKIREARLC